MNLAILIGVSDYADKANDLPACRHDINSMIAVIEATEKYDQIVKFDGVVNAADLKSGMAQTIESLSESQIDEIFFYYTGHGDFRDNEFFFMLSDYSEGKLRQTSLQNSEIDNWLRTLKPRLAVKVVDACHAGISYVKDKKYLETLLQKTIVQFNSCYFMFSSTSQQYSYQDNSLSFFTRSFIQALNSSTSNAVRFKDIIDFISDDFESNQVQTPVFVTQATFTEVFTQRTEQLIEATKTIIGVPQEEAQIEPQPAGVPQVLTLEEMVRKDAQSYPSKQEVNTLLTGLKALITEHKHSNDFVNLYDVEYSFENSLYSLPKKATIGEWLDNHQDEYFASIEERQEEYQAQVFSYRGLIGYSSKPEYETRYRRKIVGFELTDDSPYHWVKLVAKPKYLNLPWCNCSFVVVLSKRVIKLFYFFTEYRDKNWDERELKLDFSWKSVEYLLIEDEKIKAFVSELQERFASWVIEQVRKRFPQSAT